MSKAKLQRIRELLDDLAGEIAYCKRILKGE